MDIEETWNGEKLEEDDLDEDDGELADDTLGPDDGEVVGRQSFALHD